MKSLRDIFDAHDGRQIDKWLHYFPVYEKHFARFRNTHVRLLELGVDHGGSLQMWKKYLGPWAEIIGVDINPLSKYEEPQITVHTMDERDPDIRCFGPFDIVIDDGSHILGNQATAFRNLWPKTNHVYLIEDCHGEFPVLSHQGSSIRYEYPWVVVMERPQRVIRGTPSRDLRGDEIEAREMYAK